jgi:hypothetical protein
MELNFTENEVWTFKLTSGEELIAKVVGKEEQFLIIEEPVSIAPGPKGIGLVPSIFTADAGQKVKLNTNTITLIAHTQEDVKVKYIEATTGISVPSKKIVMG